MVDARLFEEKIKKLIESYTLLKEENKKYRDKMARLQDEIKLMEEENRKAKKLIKEFSRIL